MIITAGTLRGEPKSLYDWWNLVIQLFIDTELVRMRF